MSLRLLKLVLFCGLPLLGIGACESDTPKNGERKKKLKAIDEGPKEDEGTPTKTPPPTNLKMPGGEFYFLKSLTFSRNDEKIAIKAGKSATVAEIELNAAPGDVVGISTSARFQKDAGGEGEGKVFGIIDVGLENDNPRVAKTFTDAMTKQSVSMFYSENGQGPKSYKYRLWNTTDGRSIDLDKDDAMIMAEVYTKMSAASAKDQQGYFLVSYQKITKLQQDTVNSGDKATILLKELSLKQGDLVVVAANIGWRSSREDSEEGGDCDGADVKYNLYAGEEPVDPNESLIKVTANNLDESTLQYYVYEAADNEDTEFGLDLEVDGGSGCALQVSGYASMYVRVFRQLKHLGTDLGLAYYLVEMGFDRNDGNPVGTVKEGELEIQPIFKKSVKLYPYDVFMYEIANRVKVGSSQHPTRALVQVEHEETGSQSNVARAAMSDKYTKALIYLSSGIYTEEDLDEVITLKAGGYQKSLRPYDIDDIHFRFAIYGKLAK